MNSKNTKKTEKEVLIAIAKRLDVLIPGFTMKNSITISAYYDLDITFDDNGNILEFNTRP